MKKASLLELDFGEGLAKHLFEHDLDKLLGYRCQPPLYYLSSPIAEQPITPLWECGVVLTYYDNAEKTFKKCSLEAIDTTWFVYRSAQAVLAALFIDLYEDELSIAELTAVASLVGFEYVERFINEVQGCSREEYETWRVSFPATCDG